MFPLQENRVLVISIFYLEHCSMENMVLCIVILIGDTAMIKCSLSSQFKFIGLVFGKPDLSLDHPVRLVSWELDLSPVQMT